MFSLVNLSIMVKKTAKKHDWILEKLQKAKDQEDKKRMNFNLISLIQGYVKGR